MKAEPAHLHYLKWLRELVIKNLRDSWITKAQRSFSLTSKNKVKCDRQREKKGTRQEIGESPVGKVFIPKESEKLTNGKWRQETLKVKIVFCLPSEPVAQEIHSLLPESQKVCVIFSLFLAKFLTASPFSQQLHANLCVLHEGLSKQPLAIAFP